ncbi:MAG: hypothetical protein ACJ75J_15615 [Cytophagaceae bacterium]
MKRLSFFIFLFPLLSNAQISHKHLKIINQVSSHLSNDWIATPDSAFIDRNYPGSYYLSLFTKLTDRGGNNVGASIEIINRKYKEKFIKIKPGREGEIFEFIETKSYIIRIDYCVKYCMFKDCSECERKYVQMMPTLISELKKYFTDNYKKL